MRVRPVSTAQALSSLDHPCAVRIGNRAHDETHAAHANDAGPRANVSGAGLALRTRPLAACSATSPPDGVIIELPLSGGVLHSRCTDDL
eukprot:scaffold148969_cov27-Tisochrysis_lutea.AAC.2